MGWIHITVEDDPRLENKENTWIKELNEQCGPPLKKQENLVPTGEYVNGQAVHISDVDLIGE